jgi:hypothetical protein
LSIRSSPRKTGPEGETPEGEQLTVNDYTNEFPTWTGSHLHARAIVTTSPILGQCVRSRTSIRQLVTRISVAARAIHASCLFLWGSFGNLAADPLKCRRI